MFDMTVDGWELVLRALLVYSALLLMIRLSGKRTIGQFTPFDLLVVMLLSEAASNSLSGGDESLQGGLLLCATLISLNVTLAFLSARSRRFELLFSGEAVLIGRDGRIFDAALRRHHVSQNDIDGALREADCDLHELRFAFLEADGRISVQKTRPDPAG